MNEGCKEPIAFAPALMSIARSLLSSSVVNCQGMISPQTCIPRRSLDRKHLASRYLQLLDRQLQHFNSLSGLGASKNSITIFLPNGDLRTWFYTYVTRRGGGWFYLHPYRDLVESRTVLDYSHILSVDHSCWVYWHPIDMYHEAESVSLSALLNGCFIANATFMTFVFMTI